MYKTTEPIAKKKPQFQNSRNLNRYKKRCLSQDDLRFLFQQERDLKNELYKK